MANTRESQRGNLIKLIREVPAQELIFYTQPRLIIHVYIVFAEAEPLLG
jgi:hypothetical protein